MNFKSSLLKLMNIKANLNIENIKNLLKNSEDNRILILIHGIRFQSNLMNFLIFLWIKGKNDKILSKLLLF